MCCRNTIFPNHYTPRGARTQFSLELGREARSPPQPASSRGLGNVQFVWLFLSTGTRKLIIGGTRGEPEPAIGMGFPERKPFPWGGRRCLTRRTGAGSPSSASRAAPGSQHCDTRGWHRALWFGMAGAPMSRYVTAHHVSPCQDASHCHTACQDVSHCVISHHAISSPCQDTSRCVTPRYAMEGQHHGPYSRPSACSQWGRGGSLLESSAGSPVGKTMRGKSLLKKPHSCLGSG